MIRYMYDARGVYIGSGVFDRRAPLPAMSTGVMPPETSGSEVAAWRGTQWVLLPEAPEEVIPAGVMRERELRRRTEPEKLIAALEAVAELAVKPALDTLADPDKAVALFPEWAEGEQVALDDVRAFDGVLWRVRQAHTTQSDWTPPQVPALWLRVKQDGSNEWVAGISVTTGEEYTYQGVTYRVAQSHVTQEGWEPPAAPALWAVV